MGEKQKITLRGEDLIAAREVVKSVLLNRACDGLSRHADDPLGALIGARPMARLLDVLGDHDSYADAALTSREAELLREAAEELRYRVESEMTDNWPYFDRSKLGTADSKRRAREFTMAQHTAVERVEAALEREAGGRADGSRRTGRTE